MQAARWAPAEAKGPPPRLPLPPRARPGCTGHSLRSHSCGIQLGTVALPGRRSPVWLPRASNCRANTNSAAARPTTSPSDGLETQPGSVRSRRRPPRAVSAATGICDCSGPPAARSPGLLFGGGGLHPENGGGKHTSPRAGARAQEARKCPSDREGRPGGFRVTSRRGCESESDSSPTPEQRRARQPPTQLVFSLRSYIRRRITGRPSNLPARPPTWAPSISARDGVVERKSLLRKSTPRLA